MSYSFVVRASNKAEANQKAVAQLDAIVASQPVHAHDVEQAKATVAAFVGMLVDDESRDVVVSVNGSIWYVEGAGVQSSGVGINASLQPKAV